MAPIYNIEPVRPARSDSESDFEHIPDDESIEIIDDVDDESTNYSMVSNETVPLVNCCEGCKCDDSETNSSEDDSPPDSDKGTEKQSKECSVNESDLNTGNGELKKSLLQKDAENCETIQSKIETASSSESGCVLEEQLSELNDYALEQSQTDNIFDSVSDDNTNVDSEKCLNLPLPSSDNENVSSHFKLQESGLENAASLLESRCVLVEQLSQTNDAIQAFDVSKADKIIENVSNDKTSECFDEICKQFNKKIKFGSDETASEQNEILQSKGDNDQREMQTKQDPTQGNGKQMVQSAERGQIQHPIMKNGDESENRESLSRTEKIEDDQNHSEIIAQSSRSLLNEVDIDQILSYIRGNQEGKFSDEQASIEEASEPCEEKISALRFVGKFQCKDEHIKIKSPSPMRVDQLGFSARIIYENVMIKLHNESCLMSADDNFLAKVQILTPELLEETMNFDQAKKVLSQQLRIVKVLQDDMTTGRFSRQTAFLDAVNQTLKLSTMDERCAMNCVQLAIILNTSKDRVTRHVLCHEITENPLIADDLKQLAFDLNETENRVLVRNRLWAKFGLPHTDLFENLYDCLQQILVSNYTDYKNLLLQKAPKFLHDSIKNLDLHRVPLIRVNDIKLFTDLSGTLNEAVFQKPLSDLAHQWIANIVAINIKKLNQIGSQTNPIYFFLCKSLDDLITVISNRTEHSANELLFSNNSGWHPIKKIKWKSENAFTKCLEREYYFIFKLLKHFELGSSASQKRFEYKVKMFSEEKQESRWKKIIEGTKKLLGIHETLENNFCIADEFYVWYCLLDDVLAHVLPRECRLDSFETIIQSYLEFLCHANHDQLETLRVITHNTARFMVQTVPYVTLEDSSVIDRQILQKQLDLINLKATNKTLSSNSFRDLIDVFNIYWKNREDIISRIPLKILLPEMFSLKDTLLEIVLVALTINGTSDEMVAFFRAYNDLLVDLNDVQFEWYLKKITECSSIKPFVDLSLIKPIENKWTNTDNATYCVTDPAKFSKLVPIILDGIEVPKHYIVLVVSTLLSYIKQQLNKTEWKDGTALTQTDQICTTNELIFAVRNSFLYLLEQPEYVSFELFYDERIKPFASVVNNSESYRDFTNRIYLIKESFWHIRKQNEMDVDKALELFQELNNDTQHELLRKAYQQYETCFQQFMQQSEEDLSKKANNVKRQVLELTSKAPFKSWTESYKQEKLPEILAGLAAVWSILVSKDVSGTGKYLTPHCIQILCILRLLSVDRAEKGVVKHLAEVLTGQGKSLVLGLLAALFALLGHKPKIVCYNQYLVERDQLDFHPFYALFNVNNDITYSTYDQMANDIIAPIINGQRTGLRDLVTNLLLQGKASSCNKLVTDNYNNAVLLIDEVDVFFTKQFYGSVYGPVNRLMLQGVDKIQQRIWSLVSENPLLTSEPIAKNIHEFIKSSDMADQTDFHNFMSRTTPYDLLIYRDGKTVKKSYTNSSLFEEHLREMIKCADDVKRSSMDRWKNYKLSKTGTILSKYRERYVNYNITSYYMVFNYFRLRQSNFSTKVGSDVNYGYLCLDCGSISYAMLPKRYPLILGVSGTITSLNQYEKNSIQNVYSIRELSAMPSFFGCSNLKFNPLSDFQILMSKSEWFNSIFSRANAILGAKRSVLLFFENDTQLHEFHGEYSGQFDRLNVLTEDTDPKQKQQFIDEAGVAKTITLATRGMGRGVDYKSSVSIEKHGGLHVIQTFFSLDIKEEVQIKGRTARKDNQGSYELIVFHDDLEKNDLSRKVLETTYQQFNLARLGLAMKENELILKSIEKSTDDHETTMQYMKTLL
ncbi:uncharacterized protein LOC131434862 [Malaya genurostris]|uniref:uncharacterized protein LOC131434862 n=1 Tax=Malaya genurostris TaxID=325434 RepID=UPI0026F3EF04|nr:uncharacterized protein LOC131434862 [Malaya genurostris]